MFLHAPRLVPAGKYGCIVGPQRSLLVPLPPRTVPPMYSNIPHSWANDDMPQSQQFIAPGGATNRFRAAHAWYPCAATLSIPVASGEVRVRWTNDLGSFSQTLGAGSGGSGIFGLSVDSEVWVEHDATFAVPGIAWLSLVWLDVWGLAPKLLARAYLLV